MLYIRLRSANIGGHQEWERQVSVRSRIGKIDLILGQKEGLVASQSEGQDGDK